MKVVINRCYGGFGLSREACEFLGLEYGEYGFYGPIDRTDPRLVECVEKLGDRANGEFSKLKVVEVPDKIDWRIEEYDGIETIEEFHRIWY